MSDLPVGIRDRGGHNTEVPIGGRETGRAWKSLSIADDMEGTALTSTHWWDEVPEIRVIHVSEP